MTQLKKQFHTAVLGAGLAGTGLLYNALRKKSLQQFLDAGVAYIDKSDNFGCGTIGSYVINSDTAGAVFLESLPVFNETEFTSARLNKLRALISRRAGQAVPLEWVGDFYRELGKILEKKL